MTADQARELSQTIRTPEGLNQIKSINQLIQQEANKGKHKLFYYYALLPGVANKLIRNGFSVSEETDPDGLLVTIDWELKQE